MSIVRQLFNKLRCRLRGGHVPDCHGISFGGQIVLCRDCKHFIGVVPYKGRER